MRCCVGLDVAMAATADGARNAEGRILGQRKTATDPAALATALGRIRRPKLGGARNRADSDLAAPTADGPRSTDRPCRRPASHSGLRQMPNKTAAGDTAVLSALARTGCYRAVRVRIEAAQSLQALFNARELPLRRRMNLDITIHGLLTSLGVGRLKAPRRRGDQVELALHTRGARRSTAAVAAPARGSRPVPGEAHPAAAHRGPGH